MRNRYLILLVLSYTPSGMMAATDYFPIIEDGKIWEYMASSRNVFHYMKLDGTVNNGGKIYTRFYHFKRVEYDQDALFSHNEWKVIKEEDKYSPYSCYYLREEGEKVYLLYDKNTGMPIRTIGDDAVIYDETLLYDFTLSDGDHWDYPSRGSQNLNELKTWTIVEDSSMEVGGEKCRALHFKEAADQSPVGKDIKMVEGIGVLYNGHLAEVNIDLVSGNMIDNEYPTLMSTLSRVISPTGDVIYKNEELSYPVADIDAIEEDPQDDPIYDLNGLRVERPQRGGVYVRNGKKYIGK